MSVEQPSGECRYICAVVWHTYVRYKLVCGISEPHGFDVSSYDVGGLVAGRERVMLDGGGHGVGVGFDEYVKKGWSLYEIMFTILFL